VQVNSEENKHLQNHNQNGRKATPQGLAGYAQYPQRCTPSEAFLMSGPNPQSLLPHFTKVDKPKVVLATVCRALFHMHTGLRRLQALRCKNLCNFRFLCSLLRCCLPFCTLFWVYLQCSGWGVNGWCKLCWTHASLHTDFSGHCGTEVWVSITLFISQFLTKLISLKLSSIQWALAPSQQRFQNKRSVIKGLVLGFFWWVGCLGESWFKCFVDLFPCGLWTPPLTSYQVQTWPILSLFILLFHEGFPHPKWSGLVSLFFKLDPGKQLGNHLGSAGTASWSFSHVMTGDGSPSIRHSNRAMPFSSTVCDSGCWKKRDNAGERRREGKL